MEIKKAAVAGTLESSDVMITISPGKGNLEIDLQSPVDMYYHDEIMAVIKEVLESRAVSSAVVQVVDHGALDCTIKARMATAIKRAAEGE